MESVPAPWGKEGSVGLWGHRRGAVEGGIRRLSWGDVGALCHPALPAERLRDMVGARSPQALCPPILAGQLWSWGVPFTPFLPPSLRMEARTPSKPRLAWVKEDEAGPAPSSGLKCNEMHERECAGAAGRGCPPCPALSHTCSPQPGIGPAAQSPGSCPTTASLARNSLFPLVPGVPPWGTLGLPPLLSSHIVPSPLGCMGGTRVPA